VCTLSFSLLSSQGMRSRTPTAGYDLSGTRSLIQPTMNLEHFKIWQHNPFCGTTNGTRRTLKSHRKIRPNAAVPKTQLLVSPDAKNVKTPRCVQTSMAGGRNHTLTKNRRIISRRPRSLPRFPRRHAVSSAVPRSWRTAEGPDDWNWKAQHQNAAFCKGKGITLV